MTPQLRDVLDGLDGRGFTARHGLVAAGPRAAAQVFALPVPDDPSRVALAVEVRPHAPPAPPAAGLAAAWAAPSPYDTPAEEALAARQAGFLALPTVRPAALRGVWVRVAVEANPLAVLVGRLDDRGRVRLSPAVPADARCVLDVAVLVVLVVPQLVRKGHEAQGDDDSPLPVAELAPVADGLVKASVVQRTDGRVAVDVATVAPSLLGARLNVRVADADGRELVRGRIELVGSPRASGFWLLPDECQTRAVRVSVEVAP